MERRKLSAGERATLIESLTAQLRDVDLSQVDDIIKVIKARIAFLAVERTEAPTLQFSY